MNSARGLVFATAALAAWLVASTAASAAAVTADRIGTAQHPPAPALLQLAQAAPQTPPSSNPPPTHPLTEEQRTKIKSAVENISPEEVKQAALDIVTGIDQQIHGVATYGTEQQKARLAARLHRAYRVWKKEHSDSADRDDLARLLIKIASIGVSVEEVIIPTVQHVREAAAARPHAAPAAAADHPAVPVIIPHHH